MVIFQMYSVSFISSYVVFCFWKTVDRLKSFQQLITNAYFLVHFPADYLGRRRSVLICVFGPENDLEH